MCTCVRVCMHVCMSKHKVSLSCDPSVVSTLVVFFSVVAVVFFFSFY